MRDLDIIDSELRLLAAVRWSIREHGDDPSSRQIDARWTSATSWPEIDRVQANGKANFLADLG